MTEKILIAYATKCGSTAEVAEAVGEAMAGHGLDVHVRPAAQVDHIAEYNAVVVGCPILYASPHSDAVGLLHRIGRTRQTPGGLLPDLPGVDQDYRGQPSRGAYRGGSRPGGPAAESGKLSYWERSHLVSALVDQMLDAAPDVTPVSVGVFRGRMRYSDLNPADWLLMRAGRLLFSVPAGDFRNWPAIRSWAADLPTALLPAGRTGN